MSVPRIVPERDLCCVNSTNIEAPCHGHETSSELRDSGEDELQRDVRGPPDGLEQLRLLRTCVPGR